MRLVGMVGMCALAFSALAMNAAVVNGLFEADWATTNTSMPSTWNLYQNTVTVPLGGSIGHQVNSTTWEGLIATKDVNVVSLTHKGDFTGNVNIVGHVTPSFGSTPTGGNYRPVFLSTTGVPGFSPDNFSLALVNGGHNDIFRNISPHILPLANTFFDQSIFQTFTVTPEASFFGSNSLSGAAVTDLADQNVKSGLLADNFRVTESLQAEPVPLLVAALSALALLGGIALLWRRGQASTGKGGQSPLNLDPP